MGPLLAELMPFALGLAVTPTAIAAGILFLGSQRPVPDDIAFTVPFVLVYAAISAAVLAASGAAAEPLVDDHGKSVASLAVGVLLLVLAVATVVRHRRHPDAPAKRGLLARIDDASPAGAFGLGAVVAVLNPNVAILLAGLTAITAAEVPGGEQAIAAAFLVVASVAGLVAPLLWYLRRGDSADRGLDHMKAWLGRHEHAVNVGVFATFGVLFTLKGLAGL